MKVLCDRPLYWRQVPGYSGSLTANPKIDPDLADREVITQVFQPGKKYRVLAEPYRESNGLEYITLYAVGDDGRAYKILRDSLHWNTSRFALDCFDFPAINALQEIAEGEME